MFAKRTRCWTVLYRSVSRIESAELIPAFGEILTVSIRNNLRDGVTGFLAYDRGRFFQILEGAREAVTSCYAKIKSDSRHGRVETLIDERVARRTFGQWSMGFVDAFDLEDYVTLSRGLHSNRPGEVFETMARIGLEDRLR